jgi:hypothetical protein
LKSQLHPRASRVATRPLKPILDRYDLCQQDAFDTAQVALVNAMDPADALAIAHFLHEHLVFTTREYGIFPSARTEDFLELCESDDAFRNGLLKARCDFEIDAAKTGMRTEEGWVYTGETAQALADALNQLYGIQGQDLCDRLGANASWALLQTIDAARGCETDTDCVEVARSTSCFDTCSGSIAASQSTNVDATKELLEQNQCAAFARAECSFTPPPCTPPGPPTCIDGSCR